jgi:hypothetical protein
MEPTGKTSPHMSIDAPTAVTVRENSTLAGSLAPQQLAEAPWPICAPRRASRARSYKKFFVRMDVTEDFRSLLRKCRPYYNR